jgi:hypothetical protein
MMMMRPDRNFEALLRESEMGQTKFEDFIDVFPGCIEYFSNRLAASIDDIQQ